MRKLKLVAVFLSIVILFGTLSGPVLGYVFPYDPFDKYGKKLPWPEDGNGFNDYMVMTRNPQGHFNEYGTIAHDFAKNGGDSVTINVRVLAISDGVIEKVAKTGENGGLGRYVIIDHQNGFKSRYSHLGIVGLEPSDVGEPIRQGQELGYIGSTGNATAANLELTIFYNGTRVSGDFGGSFDGLYSKAQSNPNWKSPVNFADTVNYSILKSDNNLRDADPTNEWDPPVIDTLSRYLENYGYMFPSGMIAEPINAATGNFVHRGTDVETKVEEGAELKFERFYNALDNYNGSLGAGWSHSFDIKLLAHAPENNIDEEGNVIQTTGYLYSVKFGDGRGETFVETDNNFNKLTTEFTSLTDFSVGTLTRKDESSNYEFAYNDGQGNNYVFYGKKDISKFGFVTDTGNFGKIKRIDYVDGNSLRFLYNDAGELAEVKNNRSQKLNFAYDASGKLKQVRNEAGIISKYSYDFDGNLANVEKPNGKDWNYEYNSSDRIKSIQDSRGIKFVNNIYDENGRVVEQIDGEGQLTTISYDEDSNGAVTAKLTDQNGNVSTYEHDENNYLVSVIDPSGNEEKKEYDDNGRVVEFTDGRGYTTKYERDGNGNITNEVRPDGYEVESTYNDKSQLLSLTDQSGTTTFEYSSFGKVTKMLNSDGTETSYQYNSNNQLAKETNSEGNITEYFYSSDGLLKAKSDSASGSNLSYEYDDAGRRTSVKDALGRETKFEHDQFGNVSKITDARGKVVIYEYDENGNLEKEIDEDGYETIYQADQEERITQITNPNGGLQTFEYDQKGNMVKETDPNGHYQNHIYDEHSRVTNILYFDKDGNKLREESFQYDENDNIIEKTDGEGMVVVGSGQKWDNKNPEPVDTPYARSMKIEWFLTINGRDTEILGEEFIRSKVSSQSCDVRRGQATDTFITMDNIDNFPSLQEALDKLRRDNPSAELPDVKAPRICWDKDQNPVPLLNRAGSSTWEVINDNNVPVSSVPEIKVRYNWEVYSTSSNDPVTTYEYDEMNRIVRIIDALRNQKTFEYDELGRLIKESDWEGNITETKYDSQGRRTEVIDPIGNSTYFEYDFIGNLVKVTDAKGNISTKEYDSRNNLIKETDVLGNTALYTYDVVGNLISSQNFAGEETKFSYDASDNLISQTNEAGGITKLEYDGRGNITKITDANGNSSITSFDESGNKLIETDPFGNTKKYEYDLNNNLTRFVGENGNYVEYSYDGLNRSILEKDARGFSTNYSYDARGNLTNITNEKEQVTNYEYDKLNRRILTINALDQRSSFEYSANGNLKSTKDRNGEKTKFEYDDINRQTELRNQLGNKTENAYDELGRVIESTDLKGAKSYFEYDAKGNLIKQTDRAGFITTFEYDGEGKLLKTNYPDGTSSERKYDASGRLALEINQNGDQKEYLYDTAGNVIEIIDENGNSTTFKYDELNRQRELINALGQVTKYEYDVVGRLVNEIDALGNTTSYEYTATNEIDRIKFANGAENTFVYDSLGNLESSKDALGNITSYEYDDLNRQITQTLPDGSTIISNYDLLDRVTNLKDGRGNEVNFVFDEIGNIKEEIDELGNQTKYSYDKNNNLVKLELPNGAETTYEYSARDELTKVTDALGQESFTEYDELGRTVKTVNERGFASQLNYDALGRVTTLTDALGQETKFTYDKASNLLSETNPNNQETGYAYDQLNRLVLQTDANNNSKSFKFDAVGNLVESNNENNQATKYLYDSIYNRIEITDPKGNVSKYTYDLNNNLIGETDPNGNETIYSYDSRNRQISRSLPGGETFLSEFDANNNLIKEVDAKGGVKSYEYDARNLLVTEINQLNNSISYGYDNLERLAKVTNATGGVKNYSYDNLNRLIGVKDELNFDTAYGYDEVGNLISERNENGAETKYEYDELNRKLREINALGNTWEYEYDSVGNVRRSQDANGLVTFFNYDNLNRVVEVDYDSPNIGDDERYQYDNLGNITRAENGFGTLEFTYDQLNRLTETGQNQNSNIYLTKFGYDAASNRTMIQHPDGRETRYTYNVNNLPVELSFTHTGDLITSENDQALNLQTSFEYDDNLNLIRQLNPNNSEIIRDYDAANRLTRLDNRVFADTLSGEERIYSGIEFVYELNGNGDRTKETRTETIEGFDPSVRVRDYEYNSARKLTATRESNNGTANWVETYIYNNAGNRSQVQKRSASGDNLIDLRDYSYNEINQIVSDSDGNYVYDANGNLKTAASGIMYNYDSANRLVQAGRSGQEMQYEYDALGRRLSKINPDSSRENEYNGINRIDYVYDSSSWESISEYIYRDNASQEADLYTESFNLHTNYHKIGGVIVASSDFADTKLPSIDLPESGSVLGSNSLTRRGIGRYDSEKIANLTAEDLLINTQAKVDIPSLQNTNYYHVDGLGSTVARSELSLRYELEAGQSALIPNPIISNAKDLSEKSAYESFGRLESFSTESEELNYYPDAVGFDTWNSKTYSTKEFDVESDSYAYGSRNYNPITASWEKQDSYRGQLVSPISRNRYAFVNNNPVNFTDEYGFCASGYVDGGSGCVESVDTLISRNYQYLSDEQARSAGEISTSTARRNQLNELIPGYKANMNAARWSMYKAKIDYQDHTQMGGVIGRLAARGYDMDYGVVNAYMGNKIAEKGHVFAVKTQQYVAASNTYYGAVSERDWHVSNIKTYQEYSENLVAEEREFDTWVGDFREAEANAKLKGQQAFTADESVNAEEHYGAQFEAFSEENNLGDLAGGFSKYLVRHADNPDGAHASFSQAFVSQYTAGIDIGAQEWQAAEQARIEAEQAKNSNPFMDFVHGVLDVAGFIPVIGTFADGINAALYLLEGDYVNAALSAVSMIPVVGDAIGAGGKAISNGAKFLNKADDFINFAVKGIDKMKDIGKTFSKGFDDLATGIGKNLDNIGKNVTKQFDNIASGVSKNLNNFKNGVSSKIDEFAGGVKKKLGETKDFVKTKVDNAVEKYQNWGPEFKDVRKKYWKDRVKPEFRPIELADGKTESIYMELHHRFIPQRVQWAPNWLKNNRFNLKPMNTIQHAQVDPYRFKFLKPEVKEAIKNETDLVKPYL